MSYWNTRYFRTREEAKSYLRNITPESYYVFSGKNRKIGKRLWETKKGFSIQILGDWKLKRKIR